MRKKNSTNFENETRLLHECGMAYTVALIGGRWKPSIMHKLLHRPKSRFSTLKKELEGISERILVSKLKELESDGLITRISYPEVPPRVEYELTEKGLSLKAVLDSMSQWGEINRH